MSGIIAEPAYPGEVVKSALGPLSFDAVVLAKRSETYASGTVLGQIAVSARFTVLAPAANDGSQTAAAVLASDVDAAAADTRAVVLARLAEVKAAKLVWPDGMTTPQKATAAADLAARHIVIRS